MFPIWFSDIETPTATAVFRFSASPRATLTEIAPATAMIPDPSLAVSSTPPSRAFTRRLSETKARVSLLMSLIETEPAMLTAVVPTPPAPPAEREMMPLSRSAVSERPAASTSLASAPPPVI